MSRDRRAADAWPTPEPEIDESEPRWSALTDTGSMTPSPEALTWQRRADAWAQQSETEPYPGGGGQAVEPANRWSDVASTGRPAFPADGVGWRTQTSEWRATGARWRQTTEWRSTTGSHVWRSTTEAWQGDDSETPDRSAGRSGDRTTIAGTAWPTPALESGRDSSSSWSQTPSWQRDQDSGRAATTPVEQTWSTSSGTPSWQQPSAAAPSWQSGQTPSWQQPDRTPSWQQPSSPAPSWQQRPADSWSSSAPASGSWSAESGAPSSSWDTGRRSSPGENTTDVTGWDRAGGPGWQTGPRGDGQHYVREDDRAAWRRADDEWSTRRGRRRAPEPDVQPSGGTGWSGTSDADNWAGHTDTGNINVAPGSPAPDPGPPAPSWGSRSARRQYEAEQQGYGEAPRRGYAADQSSAYGERGGQTPIQYGVRPGASRRAAPEEPAESQAPAGGLPERQRGDGRSSRRPQRYNANPTNWREDTTSWESEPDTSNWTRDPDTGQWSRAEDDPRVLAWRAEAARREQLKNAGGESPGEASGASVRGGRRGRREDEPTGPVGGMPGGPPPDDPGARPRSALPAQRSAIPAQRSAMPAPRSAMPASGGGAWSTGSMPAPADSRGSMAGGAPWNGADQPEPSASGRFRTDQYESGRYPTQRSGPPEGFGSGRGAPESYTSEGGGRRRAPEPEPEAWSGRPGRRTGGPDDYPAEGWRQGPLPPRQNPPRELPAGRSGWPEPDHAQRELPAGRSSWSDERDSRPDGHGQAGSWSDRGPRQPGGYGAEPGRGMRQSGYGEPEAWRNGYGAAEAEPLPDRGPRWNGYGEPQPWQERGSRQNGYGADQGERPSWSDNPRGNGARELPAGSSGREPAYGMRELPAAPQRRDEGYRDPREPAYGEPQRELPGGPSSWAGQETPDYEEEPQRYGGARRRDDRDDPPYGGGGGRRGPGPYDGPSWTGGGQDSGGYRPGPAPDGSGYRGGPTDRGYRASAEGAAPVSGPASGGTAVATGAPVPGGDWRAELTGGATASAAAPVSGYRASAAPVGDWRADLTGGQAPGTGPDANQTPGAATAVVTTAAPAADWRAELNGTAAAPTSSAAGYRSTAGTDWRADMGGVQAPAAAPVSGSTGYRVTTAAAPATDDWRRDLAREAVPVDGAPQRFSTSDFPPFRPSGSAAVSGGENLALSATSVMSAPVAAPGAAPEEDTSWPPRRGVSSALLENTGSYERRPVSNGLLSGRQSDLLDPDEEDEEESSSSPLAAVGYTVVWYGVPVVLFVIGIFLLNGGQRAHALQTLANAAPEFGISLALSIIVAFGLRFATTAWKSASVGLAAAVVGGGLATVLSSAITGNSLS
ncbi:hypothetical protein [Actinoplanes siamensis]|nr:hypothetical protein [Actinoplanes siamensis]